jgi:hypothetical protein
VDSSALVSVEDLDKGARLAEGLIARDFPISAAFWAYAESADTWRLVIATPLLARTSRTQVYGIVQRALAELDLDIPLGRITLVRDDDPSIANLRSLVESEGSDRLAISFHHGDIAGEWVDVGFAYKTNALDYERQVGAALRRVLPEDVTIETIPESIQCAGDANSTSSLTGMEELWWLRRSRAAIR